MIRSHSEMEVEVRENMRGGEGSVTFRHMFREADFTAPVRLCARLTIPPGAGIGSHQHLAEDEIYIILRGSGILDDGATQTRVTAGDAVLTGNGESHAIRNDGDEPLELAAVITRYVAREQS
ncbi:MAG TPA: cupin domain-containing protein [Candidatus Hydrogenedentes bacterium]|nr:cupin domain-containing protein [Candidatus Hydrogenedentota bacterium]